MNLKKILHLPWFVLALSFVTIVVAVFYPIRSDDIFMYLALGRRLFNGGIPSTDPFLFGIPNYQWHVLHEWGTYVYFYTAYLIGGFTAVIASKALLICSLVFISGFRFLRQRSFLFIPLIVLALYPGAQRFGEKASLFSDLFTLMLMAALLSKSLSRKLWLIVAPVCFLVWTNLHPGMPLGFAIFGVAIAERALRRDFERAKLWAKSLGLSLMACFVNPSGWWGVWYPVEKIFNPDWQIFRKLFFEWRPTFTPGFSTSFEVMALVAMWTMAAVVLLLNWRRKPILEFLFLALMIFVGTDAIRFMLLSSLGTLIVMSQFLANLQFRPKINRIAWVTAGLGQLVLLLMISLYGYPTFNGDLRPGTGIDENQVPVKAADFIEKANWPGQMMNETDWGAYFAWRWDGQRKVFYHGHIDDPTFLDKTYMELYRSPEQFQKLIVDYDIRIFVTTTQKLLVENPKAISNLIQRVDKDWKIAHFDPLAAVLFRLP